MGTQKIQLQKTYEINIGQDSFDAEFLGGKQAVWLARNLFSPWQKRQTHKIYDSYNREMAAQEIKSLKLTNFTEVYSLTNEKNKKKMMSTIWHNSIYFGKNL